MQEVTLLLNNLGLSLYAEKLRSNRINGDRLADCRNVDDIKTIGITNTVHAAIFFANLNFYKLSGVPLRRLQKKSAEDHVEEQEPFDAHGFESLHSNIPKLSARGSLHSLAGSSMYSTYR